MWAITHNKKNVFFWLSWPQLKVLFSIVLFIFLCRHRVRWPEALEQLTPENWIQSCDLDNTVMLKLNKKTHGCRNV